MRSSLDKPDFAYSADWIHQLEKDDHWRHYWKQQELLQDILREGDHIVEIGVGSGFTTNYLRSKGFQVTTVDIDAEKAPDHVLNIATDDLPEDCDIALAFEVFEHIPLDYLPMILTKLRNRLRHTLVLSLPDHYPPFITLEGRLPVIKEFSISMKRPRWLPRRQMTTHHHWEVDHAPETRLVKLKEHFQKAGFTLLRHTGFRGLHYFVLKLEGE